jgi:microcystin-dependent protein
MNKLFALAVGALAALVLYSFASAEPKSSPSGLVREIRLTPPPGSVLAFAGNAVPNGYLECDGRAINKAEYPELFAAIGTSYSNDANGPTFNLPDCRSRTIVGVGHGSGNDEGGRALTDRVLGARFGEEKHHLTIDELPSHSHQISDPGHVHEMSKVVGAVGSDGPQRGVLDRYVAGFGPGRFEVVDENRATTNITIKPTGNDVPLNVIPPSIAFRWIIKY